MVRIMKINVVLDEIRTLWGEPLRAVCLHVIRRCMHRH